MKFHSFDHKYIFDDIIDFIDGDDDEEEEEEDEKDFIRHKSRERKYHRNNDYHTFRHHEPYRAEEINFKAKHYQARTHHGDKRSRYHQENSNHHHYRKNY